MYCFTNTLHVSVHKEHHHDLYKNYKRKLDDGRFGPKHVECL